MALYGVVHIVSTSFIVLAIQRFGNKMLDGIHAVSVYFGKFFLIFGKKQKPAHKNAMGGLRAFRMMLVSASPLYLKGWLEDGLFSSSALAASQYHARIAVERFENHVFPHDWR